MKIHYDLRKIVLFFSVLWIPAAYANPFPVIQHWTTSSGVPVYFVPAPELPMLDIQVTFAAGSARDGEKAGLSELTTHMLSEGTKHLDADQVASGFESLGAIFGTGVNRDMASVHLRSTTKNLKPALQLFTDILAMPAFPASGFQRKQKQALISLQQQEQNPGQIASIAIARAIYGSYPYGNPTRGTLKTVPLLTPADTQQFFKQYYVAQNAMITMVGAIDRKRAESIATQIAQSLKSGEAPAALPKPDFVVTKPGIKHIPYPSTQTHIRLGQVGISVSDPDYFSLIVGNHTLGGGTLVSRLANEVREKRGLSYSISSHFMTLAAPGPFYIALGTKANQAKPALSVVQTVLKDLIAKGPTEKELSFAKQDLMNSFVLEINSNHAILAQLTHIGFYKLPLNYLNTYTAQINAVSLEQVRAALLKHIKPEQLAIISVGPQTKNAR